METDEIRINKAKLRKIFTMILCCILLVSVSTNIVLVAILKKENKKTTPASVILTDNTQEKPEVKKLNVTVEYLESKLDKISELSAAKISVTGICSIEDGKIPLLTKKGYSMLYTGTITAGIDPSQIKITMDENDVTVNIPKAVIQQVKVEPDSIQFYDEKKALFNWQDLGDPIDGMLVAESDLKKNPVSADLLTQADEQVEYIVRGLLEDLVREAEGERDLKIVRI